MLDKYVYVVLEYEALGIVDDEFVGVFDSVASARDQVAKMMEKAHSKYDLCGEVKIYRWEINGGKHATLPEGWKVWSVLAALDEEDEIVIIKSKQMGDVGDVHCCCVFVEESEVHESDEDDDFIIDDEEFCWGTARRVEAYQMGREKGEAEREVINKIKMMSDKELDFEKLYYGCGDPIIDYLFPLYGWELNLISGKEKG